MRNVTPTFHFLGSSVFLLAVLALCSCSKKEEPKPTPAPSQPAPTDNEAAAPAQSGSPQAPAATPKPTESVTWTVPSSWKTMPARMMRKATYEATGKAGPAEIGVFYFGPGQGGGIEANINRWVGQFQDLPKDGASRSEKKVAGLKHTTVEVARGTFGGGMQMMPNAPSQKKDNWGMIATIVETPEGPYFFKMTGPAATVAEHKAHFDALLATVTVK